MTPQSRRQARARPRAERRRATSSERVRPSRAAAAAAAAPNAIWPGCAVERAQKFTWEESSSNFVKDSGTINVIMHNEQFGEGGLREVRCGNHSPAKPSTHTSLNTG